MIQPEEFREQCAVKLLTLVGAASHLRAFVGLDGFVDAIVHAVDKRENAQKFQRLPTISALSERRASSLPNQAIGSVASLNQVGFFGSQ